ncbi:MAG: hypothetical protein ACLQCB_18880 [Spirochaetia bacterium]
MAHRSLFVCVLLMASSVILPAATLSGSQMPPALRTEADVQGLCEDALSQIVSGDLEQGIATLRPYATSILKEDVDSLENHLVSQASTIKDSYGEALGFVLISEDNLKDTILKAVYVVKYERHLIRWTFIFYKPFDSWILDYFNYDDAIDALFAPTPTVPAPAK